MDPGLHPARLQAVAFLGCLAVRDLPTLFGTSFVFGYADGAISTLFPAIVGDHFGRGRAGALVGLFFALADATAGWGPLIAGAIYDASGRYNLTWVLPAGMNVVAVALRSAAPPPRGAGV